MSGSVYAHDLRATECTTCSDPVVVPRGTAREACDRCGEEVVLTERPAEQPPPPPPDEPARIAELFEQLDRFDPKGPLVNWVTPDLQRWELMLVQPERRDAGIAELRREWTEALAQMQADPSAEAGTRLFRIGNVLGRAYAQIDEHARSRAVLEMTLDRLPRREQRDITRCRLARHALRAGDEEAHRAWLAECDPRPTALEADGELRSTRALAAYRHEDWRGVLEALGRSHRDVPLAFTIAPLGLVLRAHALAGLGEHESAKLEIRHLSSSVPMGYVRAKQTLATHPGPASDYAIAVARKASPAPTPTRGQPTARPKLPAKQRRWWWPF